MEKITHEKLGNRFEAFCNAFGYERAAAVGVKPGALYIHDAPKFGGVRIEAYCKGGGSRDPFETSRVSKKELYLMMGFALMNKFEHEQRAKK